jgi:hypothetical protein
MFAIMLMLSIHFSVCGELCQSDARDQYARLKVLAMKTRYQAEYAAFLVRRADGGLGVVDWQEGNYAETKYKGTIPLRCIAVIHTHPLVAPQPSKHDQAEALRIGIPIVVITHDSVTVATPQGTIAQLFGVGWSR